MKNQKELGFAIVGVGMIARYHAEAIAQLPGARLVAVAGRTPDKVRAFAAQHGDVAWTTSIAQLMARPEVDVVCVCTPSGAHLEVAVAAARAGKHLLIEKPIEITLERCDQLLRAVDEAGVKMAPIFQARFGPGARSVKNVIEAGHLGRLVLASAHVKWHRTAEYYRDSWHGTWSLDGGGAVMNQAIHALDLLLWFAGMPVEVFGRTTRRVHTGIEAEDTAVGTICFANGALGLIEASTALYPGFRRRVELSGEYGSIVLEDDEITHWELRGVPAEEAVRPRGNGENLFGSGARDPNTITSYGHVLQMQDLVEAIQHDRPVKILGAEARDTVAVVRALYDSARTGRPMQLVTPPSRPELLTADLTRTQTPLF